MPELADAGRYRRPPMDVFECAVCKRPINDEPKGIVAIYSSNEPRRRPLWGPAVVLDV